MNNSKRSQKLLEIYRRLFGLYGEVECPLRHDGAFQLLVAVVLSAQTTDVRVNMVTEELFRKFGDVERFAAASPEEVGEIIRSVGLGVRVRMLYWAMPSGFPVFRQTRMYSVCCCVLAS